MIEFTDSKTIKVDNINPTNIQINLNSGYKKKTEQFFYTIPEEDNESYDSMSLKNSIRNSARATPNLQEQKKKSINNLPELNLNNNLFNTFSKDKSNLNLDKNIDFRIDEKNLGEEEEIDNINKNKIEITDLKIKLEDKNDMNYSTPESKEKIIEKIYEKVQNNDNVKNESSEQKEFLPLENEDIRFSDFSQNLDELDKKNEEKDDIKNKENININIINDKVDDEPKKQIIINEDINIDKDKNEIKHRNFPREQSGIHGVIEKFEITNKKNVQTSELNLKKGFQEKIIYDDAKNKYKQHEQKLPLNKESISNNQYNYDIIIKRIVFIFSFILPILFTITFLFANQKKENNRN